MRTLLLSPTDFGEIRSTITGGPLVPSSPVSATTGARAGLNPARAGTMAAVVAMTAPMWTIRRTPAGLPCQVDNGPRGIGNETVGRRGLASRADSRLDTREPRRTGENDTALRAALRCITGRAECTEALSQTGPCFCGADHGLRRGLRPIRMTRCGHLLSGDVPNTASPGESPRESADGAGPTAPGKLTAVQQAAIAELFGSIDALAQELGERFSAGGYGLALVGGPVRGALLRRGVPGVGPTTH